MTSPTKVQNAMTPPCNPSDHNPILKLPCLFLSFPSLPSPFPHHFLTAPKFVLAFLTPLSSPSLSSAAPAPFLFFFPPALLSFDVALVGVAAFEPVSAGVPFRKVVERGVGALMWIGVEAAVSAGESYSLTTSASTQISLTTSPPPIPCADTEAKREKERRTYPLPKSNTTPTKHPIPLHRRPSPSHPRHHTTALRIRLKARYDVPLWRLF